jgi:hypothetical protein
MDKWRIYLQEARTQIRFALRSYSEFELARDAGDVETVFYSLHHFIVHVANVDRILDVKPGSERATIFAGRIDLQGLNMKIARKLRNHLEHFDERLDRWISMYYGHAFFDMNITTGSTGFPYHAALRALDGDTVRFFGEAYLLPDVIKGIGELDVRLAAIEDSTC